MRVQFDEEMGGRYEGTAEGFPGGEFVFRVHVDCGDVDLKAARGKITGTVQMEGVVDDAPIEGSISVSPHWHRHVVYAFRFEANGKTYQFHGTKQVRFLHLARTMTTLPGEVVEAESGARVADVLTTFKIRRDMWSFLRSYRFDFGGVEEPAVAGGS